MSLTVVLGKVLTDFLAFINQGSPLPAVGACAEDMEQIEHILRFANAAGAMVTRQRGAIRALPMEEEVRNFIRQGTQHGG